MIGIIQTDRVHVYRTQIVSSNRRLFGKYRIDKAAFNAFIRLEIKRKLFWIYCETLFGEELTNFNWSKGCRISDALSSEFTARSTFDVSADELVAASSIELSFCLFFIKKADIVLISIELYRKE